MGDVATAQFGVVSRTQLLAFGVGEDGVQTWLDTGRLHRVFQGVYAVGHRALHPRARAFAGVLACGDGAVVSHASAADLLGLRRSAAAVVDVSVPDRSGRRQPGIRLHRPRVFDGVDACLVDGIPCTTVARTLVDLAGAVGPVSLERAVERAEQLGSLDVAAIAAVLERVCRPRGVRALRRILGDERLGAVFTRSQLERRFLALCRSAGLPAPTANTHVEVEPGTWLEVDFLWPARRLVVETDGWAAHGTRAAARRDRHRDRRLRTAGFRVERFMWDDVAAGGAGVVAELRALAER